MRARLASKWMAIAISGSEDGGGDRGGDAVVVEVVILKEISRKISV